MSNFTVPNTFVAGTQVRSNEMNENFTAIKNALNEKALKEGDETQSFKIADATLANHAVSKNQLQTKFSEVQETINTNGVNFCVHKGNITDSKEDLITYSSNSVTFKVGGTYEDLVLGYLDGKIITKTELNALDMSGKSDGIYNIFVPHSNDAYVLKNTIYRQFAQPTCLENDIWLDFSQMPLKAYKYTGTEFVEFNDIPIGSITIASNLISAVETFKYNQNGYSINSTNLVSYLPDYDSAIALALSTTTYTAPSDGYMYILAAGINTHLTCLINNVQVFYNEVNTMGAIAPIAKGQIWTRTGGSGIYLVTFIPMKGRN